MVMEAHVHTYASAEIGRQALGLAAMDIMESSRICRR